MKWSDIDSSLPDVDILAYLSERGMVPLGDTKRAEEQGEAVDAVNMAAK